MKGDIVIDKELENNKYYKKMLRKFYCDYPEILDFIYIPEHKSLFRKVAFIGFLRGYQKGKEAGVKSMAGRLEVIDINISNIISSLLRKAP
jgi:hypothetical protein